MSVILNNARVRSWHNPTFGDAGGNDRFVPAFAANEQKNRAPLQSEIRPSRIIPCLPVATGNHPSWKSSVGSVRVVEISDRSSRGTALLPVGDRIGDPAIDGRFVPASAVDADRYLPGERPLRDLAIESGTGKPGAGQNGLHTNDTIRIVHGAVLSIHGAAHAPKGQHRAAPFARQEGRTDQLGALGFRTANAGGLWRSVAEQGGNRRRASHAKWTAQIFSHRVPRTQPSTFPEVAIRATGQIVQVDSFMAIPPNREGLAADDQPASNDPASQGGRH